MFTRARIRLTFLYIALFAVVLGGFSLLFYLLFATALAPTFDIGPEVTNAQAAELAYQATIDRFRLALIGADLVAVVLVGGAAWILASRTLRPIREAHAQQRRFVADASHEMRTPLAMIRASAEGALAGTSSIGDLRASLDAIVLATDRLARLTNDLLLLARVEGQQAEPVAAPIDLAVLVAETVASFASAHPELPGVRLGLDPDLEVRADADELRRIVANLLDNACRYGGSGGAAPRVSTRQLDREAVVEVADSGPGIAAADLERIFEPFHRVHADADAPDGTGLGLAIARGLARRNGGRLTVVSRPGEGAIFRFYLPRFR